MKKGRRIAALAKRKASNWRKMHYAYDSFKFRMDSLDKFIEYVNKALKDADYADNSITANDMFYILMNRYSYMPTSYKEEYREQIREYFTTSLLNHKKEVFLAGLEIIEDMPVKLDEIGIDGGAFITNLIIHDLSKYSDAEFGYATHNFGGENSDEQKNAFEISWHHHKISNKHHPEHWHSVNRDGTTTALPMQNIYILEMIADWIGAGRTYGNKIEDWLPNNINTFSMHEESRKKLDSYLDMLGIDYAGGPDIEEAEEEVTELH